MRNLFILSCTLCTSVLSEKYIYNWITKRDCVIPIYENSSIHRRNVRHATIHMFCIRQKKFSYLTRVAGQLTSSDGRTNCTFQFTDITWLLKNELQNKCSIFSQNTLLCFCFYFRSSRWHPSWQEIVKCSVEWYLSVDGLCSFANVKHHCDGLEKIHTINIRLLSHYITENI